jgi:hypothetical protein
MDIHSGHGPGHPSGQGDRTGGEEGGVQTPEVQLSAEEQRRALVFAKWRNKFYDVQDERFDQVVHDLQVPLSIRAIARGLIEAGFCAHLNPITVRTRLTKFRDAMGWPKYSDQLEEPEQEEKEDEADQLIEEAPVMKRLSWLIRVQQSRVRKALHFEGQMAGMVLPMASAEMKFLSDLLAQLTHAAQETSASA